MARASAFGAPAGRTASGVTLSCLTAAVALSFAGCARPYFDLGGLQPFGSVGDAERFGEGIIGFGTSGETVTFVLAEAAEVALVAVSEDGRPQALYPLEPAESSRYEAGLHTLAVPVLEGGPLAQSPGSTSTTAGDMAALRQYNACEGTTRTAQREAAERAAAQSRAGSDTSRAAARQPSAPFYPQYSTGTSVAERCGTRPQPSPVSRSAQPSRPAPRDDVVVLVVSHTPLRALDLRARIAGLRVRTEADLRALPALVAGDPGRSWAGYYFLRYHTLRMQARQ